MTTREDRSRSSGRSDRSDAADGPPQAITTFACRSFRSTGTVLEVAIETLTELGATDAFVALIPPGRQDPEIRLTPGLAFPDPAVVRAVARASDAPYEAEIDGRTFVIRSANATNETVLIAVATPDRPLIDRWGGVLMLPIVTTAAVARERRTAEEMHRLNATTSRVAASLRLDEVLTAIVGDAVELLGASSGDVLLLDEDREVLRVAAVANLLPEMVGFEMRNDEGVSARAMATKRTMIVDDYERYRHRVRRLDRYRFRAVLCAPLMVRDTPIGALNVHATDAARRFDASDASLLSAFASHAAIAIDNARRFGNETRLSSDLTRVNHELERSLTLQRRLAEQVLMGAGPVGVAEELARLLDRTVVLQDAVLRIVAGASPLGEDWETLALVRDGGVVDAAIDDAIASGRPTTVAADDARLIAPVRIGPEVIGFLVLAETDPLSALDRALVDVAVTGVALEFAHLRAEVEVERRLRGDVVTDLVTGSFASAASVAARAAPLGLDLQVAHDVFVVRALRDADPTNVALRRQLLDLTHASVTSWSPASVVAEVADSVVVLASRRDPRRGGFGTRDAVEIATDLSSVLTQHLPNIQVAIGIGERCDEPSAYAASYRVATDAIEIAAKLGRRGGVVEGASLGIARVLAAAADATELHAFATRTLGPILDGGRGELLETLRAYVDAGFNQREAARRSFVHFNTIAYRLRRVEQALGLDLNDPAALLDVTLALRIIALAPRDVTMP